MFFAENCGKDGNKIVKNILSTATSTCSICAAGDVARVMTCDGEEKNFYYLLFRINSIFSGFNLIIHKKIYKYVRSR